MLWQQKKRLAAFILQKFVTVYQNLREASTGFEPVVRVLQTLALPLGHDAIKKLSGRWDSNPRPSPWQGDVLPLYYARIRLTFTDSAETQNRTVDTAIFSRVLYQLSYLGDVPLVKRAEFYFGSRGLSSNALPNLLDTPVSFIAK